MTLSLSTIGSGSHIFENLYFFPHEIKTIENLRYRYYSQVLHIKGTTLLWHFQSTLNSPVFCDLGLLPTFLMFYIDDKKPAIVYALPITDYGYILIHVNAVFVLLYMYTENRTERFQNEFSIKIHSPTSILPLMLQPLKPVCMIYRSIDTTG